jgi:hypothetical protein
MMYVERTTEIFTNRCSKCNHKWRAMTQVDIIDWGSGLSSIVGAKDIECPKCRRWSPIRKVNDKI